MIIALTGFMGCGKSSVGRKLSSLLSCSWADIDKEIESEEGCSVSEIFAREGEASFREKEYHCLQRLISIRTRIISLGGGTPLTEKCRKLLDENTICIWLDASADTLAEHLKNSWFKRPILSDISQEDEESWAAAMRARISPMLAERRKFYEDVADFRIDVDGLDTDEVIGKIVKTLNENLQANGSR